jgi:hypothetical protein
MRDPILSFYGIDTNIHLISILHAITAAFHEVKDRIHDHHVQKEGDLHERQMAQQDGYGEPVHHNGATQV